MPLRSTVLAASLGLLLILLAASPAAAATCTPGIEGPNDPLYAPSERGAPGTYNVEQWYMYDCIPQSAPLATDPQGSAGMFVNQAWKKYGRGSKEVTVAYMEGGINWRMPNSADLRRKAYLNPGELPEPQDAGGSTKGTDDLDGDGAFTADDFKDDPRVGRPFLHPQAGGITPEDLIVAFSDGKDDDGNGYVDDISGWNFHRDTNDPQTEQSIYNHANSEQRVLAAETDNGKFGAGMCGECRLLTVKLGDEAIDRPDRVAEGIVFAVDSGAKVLVLVVAALGQSPSMQQAVDYAHDQGAVVVWASNDFESSDHTEGMRLARVWPGNGVVSQQTNRLSQSLPNDLATTTFRSRSSVTSFGAHSLFSVASSDGSTSQSVPITGGVAALVVSAGVDAAAKGEIARPLSADEVKQVVRSTVSPITETPCGGCFPAAEGAAWNLQYGYGRPDVLAAMTAVHEGRIPPTADVRSPDWYREYDPTVDTVVPVAAQVGARGGRYRWVIEAAAGPQPRDDEFRPISTGEGTGPSTVKGSFDLKSLPTEFWSGDYGAPTPDRLSIERFDVTFRVRVSDDAGLVGEDRRVVYARHDAEEILALRKDLGASVEASPSLADIEGRGQLDVVVGTSEGIVHVLRPDGTEIPGWPRRTGRARGLLRAREGNYLSSTGWRSGKVDIPREPIASPPAVGDLEGDGGMDIVVAGLDGSIYVWNTKGRRRPGFPIIADPRFRGQAVPVPDTPYVRGPSTGNFGGVALGDLDGDGRLDIVAGGWDGKIHAWDPTGKPLPGWPVSTEVPKAAQRPVGTSIYARDFKVASTPTLVDIDGDKRPEVVAALTDSAFGEEGSPVFGFVMAYSSKGNRRKGGALMPNFPVNPPAVIQGYGTAQDFITEGVQTPAAYVAPDGRPKLVANAGLFSSVTIDLRSGDMTAEIPGTLPAESAQNLATPLIHFSASPSVGRIGGAPGVSAVQGASGITDVATGVAVTPGLGVRVRSALSKWNPATGVGDGAFTQTIQGLAFLSAPSIADISGDGKPDILLPTDTAAIHGVDGVTGRPVPGWPKWSGGWSLWSPAVGDLDGDGKVEVVAGLREGYLKAWSTKGLASGNDQHWHWHANDRNTGLLGQDTRPPAGVRNLRARTRGRNVELTFRAPGDDWLNGTAKGYEVLRSRRPIRDGHWRGVVRTRVADTPGEAGTSERLVVRAPRKGRFYYTVRAFDRAGNMGRLKVRGGKRPRLTAAQKRAAAKARAAAAKRRGTAKRKR
ncbi:MAG: VCBS repeat-containing protein [Solirubrobacterales bacterium]|nr:VCBS repeat-containing protein [Solirubrobacterales bacterium]